MPQGHLAEPNLIKGRQVGSNEDGDLETGVLQAYGRLAISNYKPELAFAAQQKIECNRDTLAWKRVEIQSCPSSGRR